ncbi:DUF6167 family protein [Aeromicrobium chenweiae]|uniref:Uncharacterized protein n=1 Tax=Aeromicrobium chenweiae TaxID=2079793 RepID=A0A2S0WMM4_9ACTN|nr:DUF6167 family protein [Aeromicrobium chenweiae]AWB92556.1 hypothetical protein C3E78_10295 [Aeromicrobium chenweiae]TGN33544.1 hypothetical protein E4L97_00335 [Aeromicrobium chenweiae]
MRSRIAWFVAGSAAGIYSTVKARRAAYRLSAPGIVDQAAALGLGWRAFSAEMQDGMQTREHDIVRRLTDDPQSSLRLEAIHPDEATPDKKAT